MVPLISPKTFSKNWPDRFLRFTRIAIDVNVEALFFLPLSSSFSLSPSLYQKAPTSGSRSSLSLRVLSADVNRQPTASNSAAVRAQS